MMPGWEHEREETVSHLFSGSERLRGLRRSLICSPPRTSSGHPRLGWDAQLNGEAP